MAYGRLSRHRLAAEIATAFSVGHWSGAAPADIITSAGPSRTERIRSMVDAV